MCWPEMRIAPSDMTWFFSPKVMSVLLMMSISGLLDNLDKLCYYKYDGEK
jgi:hypothetical protein